MQRNVKLSKLNDKKEIFGRIGQKLGIKQINDWFKIDSSQIGRIQEGKEILSKYKSLKLALEDVYPNYQWKSWKFENLPTGFWKNTENQKEFFDWLGTQIGVKQLDDWHNISEDQVRVRGGHNLLQHQSSLITVFKNIYPQQQWYPWKFKQLSNDWVKHKDNHKLFFDWLEGKLGMKNKDSWYRVTVDQISEHGGSELLKYYNNSIQIAVQKLYPEHNWVTWRFSVVPADYWKNEYNHKKFLDWLHRHKDDQTVEAEKHLFTRKYFDWVGKALEIQQLDGWYEVGGRQIQMNGGKTLLQVLYNNSIEKALQTIYPDHEWLPWRFQHTSSLYWKKQSHHRQFLDWFGKRFGLKVMEDWYQVTVEQINSVGGKGLLMYYSNSLSQALQAIYPEHEWISWRFKGTSNIESMEKSKLIFDLLGKQFGIKDMDDWYNVSQQVLQQEVLTNYKSLRHALETVYPEHKWLPWKFARSMDYWNNKESLLIFFEWFREQFGLNEKSDWYNVTKVQINKHAGVELLLQYNSSLLETLQMAYPEEEWLPWMFHSSSQYTWTDLSTFPWNLTDLSAEYCDKQENHQKFYLWLAKQLPNKIDLNHVTLNTLLQNGGRLFVQQYFQRIFDWIGKQEGVNEISHWYGITLKQIRKYGVEGLITSLSLIDSLKIAYPEHEWLPWKFSYTPSGYWKDETHHKEYFDWLSSQIGIRELDDWYSITTEQVDKHGGRGLLIQYYNSSLIRALQKVYSKHEWQAWKFKHMPKGYLKDDDNLEAYFSWLEKQLNIRAHTDWYKISLAQINEVTSSYGVVKGGGLSFLLCKVYPNVKWNFGRLGLPKTNVKPSQRQLSATVSKVLHPTIP